MVEQVVIDRLQQQIEAELRKRLPGAPIQRAKLLQYGDDPVIEPGELLVRVFIEAGASEEEQEKVLAAFEQEHRTAIKDLRHELSARLPETRRLEFQAGDGSRRGPRIVLGRPGGAHDAADRAGGELTPVMARLGPVDLETLDTLITTGIAANRADAVRWALARIRERPAYEQIRERARQIDELKTQF